MREAAEVPEVRLLQAAAAADFRAVTEDPHGPAENVLLMAEHRLRRDWEVINCPEVSDSGEEDIHIKITAETTQVSLTAEAEEAGTAEAAEMPMLFLMVRAEEEAADTSAA